MSMEEDVSNIGAKLTQTEGTVRQMSDDQFVGNIDIESIDRKMPSKGQAVMVNSLPVVIASDQSAIPITGSITAVNDSVATNNGAIPSKSTMIGGSDGMNLRPVSVDSSGKLNVNLSGTVALPTGASTSANQTNGQQKTQLVDSAFANTGNLANPIRNDPTGTTPQPVTGTFFQATQPVSGTGVAGTPAGGVLTIQGDPAGTPVPVTGTFTPVTAAAVTYSAVGFLTLAAGATDFFDIVGSATKSVRIKKIRITGKSTANEAHDLIIIKRSTPNTGGTSSIIVGVPHDSTDPAATAVVKQYSVNPTVGTLVGRVSMSRQFYNTPTTPIVYVPDFIFGENGTKEIRLNGASECLAINFGGDTVPGGIVYIQVEWTEE